MSDKEAWDEDGYQDYIDEMEFMLWEAEQVYKEKPSQLKMIYLWQGYRNINQRPPEWLLKEIDKYFESRLKAESNQRSSKGEHQMSFHDYLIIKKAASYSGEIQKYAAREKISVSAVRKRMDRWKDLQNKVRQKVEKT